jgi:hypothetical protein
MTGIPDLVESKATQGLKASMLTYSASEKACSFMLACIGRMESKDGTQGSK